MAQTTSDTGLRALYEEALTVTRPKEANRVFSQLVLTLMQESGGTFSKDEATKRVKKNLGYLAGYHSHETRRRVETLFRCVHPVLGPALKDPPDPAECFKLGEEMGKSGKFEERWQQPDDDVPPEYQLLLQNVYEFRQMLDQCYDHIEALKGKLKSLEAPAQRIKELEEENLRLRVSLKARALNTGE